MGDEIIIEVNKKNNDKNIKQNNFKKRKKKKLANSKSKIKNSQSGNIKQSNPKNTKKVKKNKRLKKIAIFLIIIVVSIIIFSSSLFNIKEIKVEGNSKVSDEKIISLSLLNNYTNIFKFNKKQIIENIKENAYIEEVEIKRNLPSTVKFIIKERVPKYMLQFADSYVYINSQGYMLEISNEKIDVPILIGFTTDLSDIKAGNRINIEDLQKMSMVIKIYEAAKSNDLGELITKIDISNEKNYTIILDSEGKTVYLGDCSDLNTKILYLKCLLSASEGKSGEIFLNMDLNSQNAYFRPSSN